MTITAIDFILFNRSWWLTALKVETICDSAHRSYVSNRRESVVPCFFSEAKLL